ncbi:MAG: LPS export ABC transporter periplasmic protein LptC [Candidatus Omnitrophica bacterium]|nr:LPS export ABC transporter periplasmic protein LptC [Candidatus Omnitrophota bacterium]
MQNHKIKLETKTFNFLIVVFTFSFCIFTFSYAQEHEKGPVEVNGDEVEYFPKEKKVVGVGNISIEYGTVLLTCNKITVYTDTKDAYAEGNVVLKSPASELRGEKVKYNFNTKKGEVLDARVKSGDWYAGGKRVELLSESSYRVEDGYITSCDLDEPHYKISSNNVVIYPDNKVVAKDVIFKVGGMPVAYLPRYNYSLDTEWPTFNVIPGKKKNWGFFALTSYRYEMDENNKLTLKIDERENWGLAEGLDYKYAFNDFGEGVFRSYYTNQRDRDRGELLKGEEERYRLQARHRWDINDRKTTILEYHKSSDDEMTKDFFYREEYDRDPSPESYIYLLDRQPEYSLGLLSRKRVNRFQSVVERLPEVRFDLKDQRLFGRPIYFKTDTSFTSLNSKTANSSTDSDVVRFDVYNKLSSPLYLADFLSVSPFVGMRDTFYSKDINGDEDELRTAFYTGIDSSMKFFKTYDNTGKFLGVTFNKLHHIITPTVEYRYIHTPSITVGELQQFDDIDSIDRTSTFSLGLENKLQTKRLIDNKLKTVDLANLLLTGDYLYRPEHGSRFSDVKLDLELTPYDWLRVEFDTLYDPSTRDFQNWNTDLYIDKGDDWRLGVGSRYWQDSEHELTSEIFFRLNNEWAFRVFGRYDLKEVESDGHKIINRFDTKEITVIKDLHCWLAEVSVDMDRDDGATLWLVLKLKASPKVPFDFKDYYAVPKNR